MAKDKKLNLKYATWAAEQIQLRYEVGVNPEILEGHMC